MSWNDHVDWDLQEAIEEAVERGFVEREALGYRIAQQVIHQGYETLSDKQRWIYDGSVLPSLAASAREIERDALLSRFPAD
jgi:hypothetical protein